MKNISLIPFPCGAGSSKAGCEQGALYLHQNGLAQSLCADGINAAWSEDPAALAAAPDGLAAHRALPPSDSPARMDFVIGHCRAFKKRCMDVLRENRTYPVTIGGDHAMAAGSLGALADAHQAHGRIGVIWIDAHADLNTPETSPSQALHGMPLAAMLGMGHDDFVALGGTKPALQPAHIFYLGLRSVDPGEWDLIRKLGIGHYTMDDLRRTGVMKGFQDALAAVSRNTDYLYVSIDLDALDPAYASAVSTPVADGLTLDELRDGLAWLTRARTPDMIEIAEFNPVNGDPQATQRVLHDILQTMLQNINRP